MGLKSRLWGARTVVTRSPTLRPIGQFGLTTVSWLLRHNPLQVQSIRKRKIAYLNAGCGKKPRAGFINLDYAWQPGVDLVYDLGWRLPFPDGSLRGIYTEHCMEHLPFRLVTEHILSEFHRVLASNGRVRFIVPNAGLYLQLYAKAQGGPGIKFPFTDESLISPMMQVNRCFRDHGHLYAYDFETIRHFMLKAGFSTVEHRQFMDGGDPLLLLDSPERAPESLYVEAVK